MIDESSVERFLAVRGESRRRAWSESTAWGGVALLTGAHAEWLGSRQRTRLKARLRELSSTDLETNDIDGYLAAGDVAGIVSRHGLIRDHDGRVTLRATTTPLDLVRDLSGRGVALAALDLAESLDVRERRAGLDALDQALEDFRG